MGCCCGWRTRGHAAGRQPRVACGRNLTDGLDHCAALGRHAGGLAWALVDCTGLAAGHVAALAQRRAARVGHGRLGCAGAAVAGREQRHYGAQPARAACHRRLRPGGACGAGCCTGARGPRCHAGAALAGAGAERRPDHLHPPARARRYNSGASGCAAGGAMAAGGAPCAWHTRARGAAASHSGHSRARELYAARGPLSRRAARSAAAARRQRRRPTLPRSRSRCGHEGRHARCCSRCCCWRNSRSRCSTASAILWARPPTRPTTGPMWCTWPRRARCPRGRRSRRPSTRPSTTWVGRCLPPWASRRLTSSAQTPLFT